MESTLDLSRWRERPRGVAYRRWTIIHSGLRQLLATRLFRLLVFAGWTAGLTIALAGFAFSQALATGGWLETWAATFGPRAQAIVSAFSGLALLYPEICIGGFYTLVFWMHSGWALFLSLIALTAMVPRLVTQDRATNALTVYLARPLTSTDYLLGKLGIIAGALVLIWTGPLLGGWMLGLLFAPDRDFIVHSLLPLRHALFFNAIALLSLAAIALGVSAAGRTSRHTVTLWIGLWIILGTVAKPTHAPSWIKRASFSYDLSEARRAVFRLDKALEDATTLPMLNAQLRNSLPKAAKQAAPNDLPGALTGLALLVALSSFTFFRKIRST